MSMIMTLLWLLKSVDDNVVRRERLQWWWEIYWARLPQLSEKHEREEETLWF